MVTMMIIERMMMAMMEKPSHRHFEFSGNDCNNYEKSENYDDNNDVNTFSQALWVLR